MIKCPSCARPQEPRLICDACGSPLPVPAHLDCFAALGFPRKLTIDTSALETAYHELGRKIHPDRFASSAPNIRALSLSGTALLTRSYRTLRDPISRGLTGWNLTARSWPRITRTFPPSWPRRFSKSRSSFPICAMRVAMQQSNCAAKSSSAAPTFPRRWTTLSRSLIATFPAGMRLLTAMAAMTTRSWSRT